MAILELKFNANEHIIRAYNCHIYLESNAKGDDEFVYGNGKAQIPDKGGFGTQAHCYSFKNCM